MNDKKPEIVYVLVPIEVRYTQGNTHEIWHRPAKSYTIQRMIDRGYSFKDEVEAEQYLDSHNPKAPLRIQFPNAKLYSSEYPDKKCNACGEKLGTGMIRWIHGRFTVGGTSLTWHAKCWDTL